MALAEGEGHEYQVEDNIAEHGLNYELGDGSKATQDGILKHVDDNHEGEAIQGRFAFISDDGEEYSISYTADENGYRPVGAHLPTPPPIPESVLKTLKYLEEHPYNPDKEQKRYR
ncbi:endocuticle structural glycoprotein SgAbd-3-like [Musca vetustissima]|uniref:endocuticle structural glycoprotein SgAbd-3-like n=1 Tax=Musca vetustissima TaxID=27455 RepID=UPI002AB6B3E6|nr:endocuticle structural glycoprotein SgAbd-3-like [Musca vetustissima]